MKQLVALMVGLVLASSAYGQGAILWDEAVNGPLSEDYHNPTYLSALQLGTNSLSGSSELQVPPPYLIVHENVFTISVPAGLEITALFLQVDRSNVWAWVGDTGFSSDLGYTRNAFTGDLLGQWAIGSLSAGAYGMYLLNLDDRQPINTVANFHLDFVVEAIPEPASLWLFSASLAGMQIRRWLRNQRR